MTNQIRHFLLAFLLFPIGLTASHNIAGNITYEYVGNNTFDLTVTTYTDPSAALVDRCEIDLEIWDATGTTKIADLTSISRQNGPANTDPYFPINCPNAQMGDYLLGTVKQNIYTTTYVFPGAGTYLIRYHDLARLDNIANMVNSGSQAFFLETTLVTSFWQPNTSAQFLNHPLDDACTGSPWTYNPGGWDSDGDSLVFSLIPCRQYDPPAIPSPISCTGFMQPDSVGTNGPMQIDAQTGLITWTNPDVAGIYNIAIRVDEYRYGNFIGTVMRDMAIFVYPCMNNPPEIQSVSSASVQAGDTLTIDFTVYDPDPGDSIYLELNNALLGLNSAFQATPPAVLTTTPSGALPVGYTDTIHGTISWATTSFQARNQPYQVDLHAFDNFGYYGSQMTNRHHIISITVLPDPLSVIPTLDPAAQFSLSPNPASDFVVLRRSHSTPGRLSILDATGREVMQREIPGKSTKVETSALAPGIYFLRLTTDRGHSTQKLLVRD